MPSTLSSPSLPTRAHRCPAAMIITKHLAKCRNNIRIKPILGDLFRKSIIPETVYCDITGTLQTSSKVDILLNYLQKAPDDKVIEDFCSVLKTSCEEQCLFSHGSLAETILNDIEHPTDPAYLEEMEPIPQSHTLNKERFPCYPLGEHTTAMEWATSSSNFQPNPAGSSSTLNLIGKAQITLMETDGSNGTHFSASTDSVIPLEPLDSVEHGALVSALHGIRSQSVERALAMAKYIQSLKWLCLDLKLAAIEAVVPDVDEALPILSDALEECEKDECLNPVILKCRIRCRLAWNYRSKDVEKALEYAKDAIKLGEDIKGDFGPAQAESYYARLLYILKKPSSKEEFDQISHHHSRATDLRRALPEWMKNILVHCEMWVAMHKVLAAQYYMDHNMDDQRQLNIEAANYILGALNQHDLRKADIAFYNQIRFLQYRLLDNKDMANQMAQSAIAYYKDSGRHDDATELSKSLSNS